MKIPVFLGEVGITSTSANHIANMAKEMCSEMQTQVNQINFVDEYVSLISSDKTMPVSTASQDINLKNKLDFIGEANSLIAWLREAIKAKDDFTKCIELELSDEYEKANPRTYEVPEKEKPITEKQYYESLPLKERNRYYSLEAKASVYGKAIHPDGAIRRAIRRAEEVDSSPYSYEGEGRDLVITKCNSHYPISDLHSMYFELQAEYRSLQAELNGIKHKCELALRQNYLEITNKYNEEFSKYSIKEKKYISDKAKYIQEESPKYIDLKIVIPDNLRAIYDKVNKLSKD
jgi:hypothetical protein